MTATTLDSPASPRARLEQGDVAFQRGLYEDRNPTRRWLHRTRRDWLLARIAAHARPGDRVAEVGVGCGIFTEAMAGMGLKVTAIDIHQPFLDNIAGLEGVAAFRHDATTPGTFGGHRLVVCSEVLEHVPPARSQAMVDNLVGLLEPGGLLILTTPQRYAVVEMVVRLFRFRVVLALARLIYGDAQPLGHINVLTHGELSRQLARAGAEIVEQDRFGLYLPLVAEAGGRAGQTLLAALTPLFRALPGLRALLWTQGWVVRRRGDRAGPPGSR